MAAISLRSSIKPIFSKLIFLKKRRQRNRFRARPGFGTALLPGAETAVFAPKPVKNERFLKIFQKSDVFSLFLASK
jgi:hypothetical protein